MWIMNYVSIIFNLLFPKTLSEASGGLKWSMDGVWESRLHFTDMKCCVHFCTSPWREAPSSHEMGRRTGTQRSHRASVSCGSDVVLTPLRLLEVGGDGTD